jgi:4-hydroxybutyrate dehydrogenase
MKIFSVAQEICYYDTFRAFAEEFAFCDTDLIFTERVLFDHYIGPCNPACKILIKDDFSVTEPDEETMDRILLAIADKKISRIIAVGGGSVIDIAKGLRIKNAHPFGRVLAGGIPIEVDKDLIVVPTTCGTGSEITSAASSFRKAPG